MSKLQISRFHSSKTKSTNKYESNQFLIWTSSPDTATEGQRDRDTEIQRDKNILRGINYLSKKEKEIIFTNTS